MTETIGQGIIVVNFYCNNSIILYMITLVVHVPGEFGIVFKGQIAIGEAASETVAIKTLKGKYNYDTTS